MAHIAQIIDSGFSNVAGDKSVKIIDLVACGFTLTVDRSLVMSKKKKDHFAFGMFLKHIYIESRHFDRKTLQVNVVVVSVGLPC